MKIIKCLVFGFVSISIYKLLDHAFKKINDDLNKWIVVDK